MSEIYFKNMSKFKSWVLASRPRTLPAAVVPVMVGSALAIHESSFKLTPALIALACSLLIQIGTNFANDLYDFLSGADTEKRKGPTRALAAGWISAKEMKLGVAITFSLAFLLGLYLVSIGGMLILVIGILSIIAGLAYTTGPYPLAYNGLGDVFVFIFFGIVGTMGTFYVHTLKINFLSFLASVPVGALITNILIVNNYRDTEEDRAAGKRTLAVILGKEFTRIQYMVFIILSYLAVLIIYFFYIPKLWIFLPLITIPVSIKLVIMLFSLEGYQLNRVLELSAKFSALYGLLFSLGIII